MADTRLAQLLRFYEEDPDDAFNIYGLALEYLKSDVNKSEELFNLLLHNFPNYLPAYYHAAKLKTALQKTEEALSIYKKGMELAVTLNERKALGELRAAYEEMVL